MGITVKTTFPSDRGLPRNSALPVVKDSLGRSFKKLRLSLTEVCNFRCSYCMPENQKFHKLPPTSPEDFHHVCRILVEHGIEEIRLTGGEPLYYPHFLALVERLSDLPVRKLALTTNAFLLSRHLPALKKTKLSSINVSLDSLNRERFHTITRSDSLPRVLGAITTACELGFEVKTNAVLLAGITDEEIIDFVQFSKQHGIIVRFLEAMKIGVMNENFSQQHVPIVRVQNLLEEKYGLTPEEVAWDSTSKVYRLGGAGEGARIGFIASESAPFCNSCSRLRVNHKLEIRPCLMKNESVTLKGVDFADYPEMLRKLLSRKPRTRIESLGQAMHEIGG